VIPGVLAAKGTVRVSVDIANAGARSGEEVVQMYVSTLIQLWKGRRFN
jgi:hypothetical protein